MNLRQGVGARSGLLCADTGRPCAGGWVDARRGLTCSMQGRAYRVKSLATHVLVVEAWEMADPFSLFSLSDMACRRHKWYEAMGVKGGHCVCVRSSWVGRTSWMAHARVAR